MDNDEYDRAVGENVKTAFIAQFGSLRGGSEASGIPYASLDRKVRGITSFNTRELRQAAQATGRKVRSFLPSETAAAR
ncbi:MAG: hypothetical protein K0S49_52 [Microbacterium sp.]|jgi:hypothetical protein|nr:hypothetical protein [Microbacterium sp.]